MKKCLSLLRQLSTPKSYWLMLLFILTYGSGFTQTPANEEDTLHSESYDNKMAGYYTTSTTPENIITTDWNLLGPTHVDATAPYLLYYYKLLQVNSNSHRYASIIDISILGDANYYQDQGTYRIRVGKFQNTLNRFDGLEIKCISGNPKAATFYVYNNALWVRSNYKWGTIYYRTLGDFTSYSPLVGTPFGQTTTAPTGYSTSTGSYGLKCDLDNNVFYKLPYTDAGGNMVVNGNIGVGTSTPQSKLAVNGTVTAKQVKVTQTGWPDYVFHKDHLQPDLSKTEVFIKANHHLPGIPSAREIESKGLDLGEMQKKQMQKIEELTLLLIRQQHEIDSLKSFVKDKFKKTPAL